MIITPKVNGDPQQI